MDKVERQYPSKDVSIAYYHGVRLEDHTKEELIEIVKEQGRHINFQQQRYYETMRRKLLSK